MTAIMSNSTTLWKLFESSDCQSQHFIFSWRNLFITAMVKQIIWNNRTVESKKSDKIISFKFSEIYADYMKNRPMENFDLSS